jgi:hypothetical protein
VGAGDLPHFLRALHADEGREVPDARGGRLDRVRGLSRLANHSSSGDMSERPWNSARLRRLLAGSEAIARGSPFGGS